MELWKSSTSRTITSKKRWDNVCGLRLEAKVKRSKRRKLFTLGVKLASDPFSAAQVIPGRKGRATDALCWVGERLFSAGLNGEITEYDLDSLRPKFSASAYGGPIWTISSNPQGTMLAVS